MMKRCSVCLKEKELIEFYQRRTHRQGEYYERCKGCFKERGRKYYHSNHDRQLYLAKVRKSRYIKQRKEWIEKVKSKPCSDCGIKYPPYVMDFDHKDGQIKVSSISLMIHRNTSNFDKIKQEIEKCDLVCANCHRVRTHKRLIAVKSAEIANVVKAPL